MQAFDIFRDIAERTGGDIYVGVVGPVRTGKSTFIKRFMELLVLPNIQNPYDRDRAKDALPQAGGGRTITTTEPKFIPDDGVEIVLKENIALRVRMVDCVGFGVDGAIGYLEEDVPRMVLTPWFDHEIPFEEAAEVGTRKVISDHCTLGVVVTTDGSIINIPRDSYVDAERRVVQELKAIGKPFVIVLNTVDPLAQETAELAARMEEEYDVSCVPLDCLNMSVQDIELVLEQVLYEFPVQQMNVDTPAWIRQLPEGHAVRSEFERGIQECVDQVKRVRDVERAVEFLKATPLVGEVALVRMDMGTGTAQLKADVKEEVFYGVVAEIADRPIGDKADILNTVREYSSAKAEYDKISTALEESKQIGYGIVTPTLSDMVFEEPELIRQGPRFGVRLRAKAPSYHIIRVDVASEVTPIIGSEKQCQELVSYLLDQFEDDPKKIWKSDVFGKPLSELVREGIQNKVLRMPEHAQVKLQETLEKVVNEGGGGLICIIM